MATNKPRYTVSVDEELFQKIENFRFTHRFQTRSEATVDLIRLGLEALGKELVDTPHGFSHGECQLDANVPKNA